MIDIYTYASVRSIYTYIIYTHISFKTTGDKDFSVALAS